MTTPAVHVAAARRAALCAAVRPLTAVVTAGIGIHLALAWRRPTPFFGDEYTYSALARSLATTGRPLIRGANAHFPALLQPLLTAPAWWLGSVEAAYRASQAIGAVCMSLAAIPVYLLGRRLGLGTRWALAAAALSIAGPSMFFSSLLMSEAVAYPLALAALAAAVQALVEPSPRTYALFAGFAAAATFARFQLAVLFPCFFAALLVALFSERRRPSRGEKRLLAALALVTVAFAAAGPARNTGYYPSALQAVHTSFHDAVAIAGANALTLVYGAGVVLVPGALLGLALMLVRPRTRTEAAFAALTSVVSVALLAQASVYGITAVVQERYLIYLLPLWTLCFAVHAARRPRPGRAHTAVAAAVVALVALVPLTNDAAYAGTSPSPDLLAVLGIGAWLGSPGDAAAAIAVVSGVLMLTACLASRVPGAGAIVALGCAAGILAVTSAAAYSYDLAQARAVASRFLGHPADVVARAVPGRVTLLLPPGYSSTEPRVRLFWNPSVDRVAVLPGAPAPDPWATRQVVVARDGTLLAAGKPLAGPLLVGAGERVELAGVRVAARSGRSALVVPQGRVRLVAR